MLEKEDKSFKGQIFNAFKGAVHGSTVQVLVQEAFLHQKENIAKKYVLIKVCLKKKIKNNFKASKHILKKRDKYII